jgi:hypothetical protein
LSYGAAINRLWAIKAFMQWITRREFIELEGLDEGVLDAMQRHGQVSLAFGASLPGTPGRYLDVDLVAMSINLGLSPTLGRATATTIVLAFFLNWIRAVARADADQTQDFFLAIGAFGIRDYVKRVPKLYGVADGTLDDIQGDFGQHADPLVSAVYVNISDIIRRLRVRARQVGINLEGRFFFLPDDPRFDEILPLVERERDARMARLRKDKKKFAATKARKRRRDIQDMSSAESVRYPTEMTA